MRLFFITCLVLPLCSVQAQTVSKQVDNVWISIGKDRAGGKPSLMYRSIAYHDENNNQILEAWEKARITFTIKNTGMGSSQNLFIGAATSNDTEIKGVIYPLVVRVDSLKPGQEKQVSIPVEGSLDLGSGIATITIKVREEFEYDPDEIEMNVVTEEFKSPKLQVASPSLVAEKLFNIPLVPVKLRTTIQNTGQGPATDVRLDFYLPDYAKPIDRPAYVLNTLKPGEIRELVFAFSVPIARLHEEIPIRAVAIERHQKYGLDTILKLQVKQGK